MNLEEIINDLINHIDSIRTSVEQYENMEALSTLNSLKQKMQGLPDTIHAALHQKEKEVEEPTQPKIAGLVNKEHIQLWLRGGTVPRKFL